MIILVTGSRKWRDRDAIEEALTDTVLSYCRKYPTATAVPQPGYVLVVHGAQSTYDRDTSEYYGTDFLAHECALRIGMSIKPFPADWYAPCRSECESDHRRWRNDQSYCPAQGNYRNQTMVDYVVSLNIGLDHIRCIAFPLKDSKGTWDCMRRATAAGIEVQNYGYQRVAT